jgi:uncharacterized protein YyaL (SSP411 family)
VANLFSEEISMRLACSLFVALSLGALLATEPGLAGGPKPKGKPRFTNRLARETSPYLLMHAHNPVDWYPWGPEAFDKAKKENKLIFLSIGYSSCYWCHVMERESFAHETIAKLLNKDFVCIKVDREERPDVDQIYMAALMALQGGRGGWPLSMFLTPDGRPIVGGTYWPREDREVDGEKERGFTTILGIITDYWKNKRKDLLKQAEALSEQTLKALDSGVPGAAVVALDRKFAESGIEDLKETFDPAYGGFGSPTRGFRGPKFPTPPKLEYLLQIGTRTKSDELIKMVTLTLDRMAHGGIYDQLGGGFHRYSTERTWTVPHFEKMLYDNAQLAELYARAYRLTKNPLYRRIVEETLAYVQREMTSPEGGFYSSQDAETHHEEGRFYVWTDKEIDEAVSDKAENVMFRELYGAKGKPNFEGKYHILTLPKGLAEYAKSIKLTKTELLKKVEPLRDRVFKVRARRDRPFRNEVMLTAWSGLMIGGLAEAGRSLDEKKYVDTAIRAAEFILKHQRTKDGRLLRTYGAQPGKAPRAAVPAYLEDYAFLVHGLLNLHDATKNRKWLDEARALTDTMIKHFGDAKRGGYFFTAHDHEKLFARTKEQFDGAQPSGNSVALRNLVRLWSATGEERYRSEAERSFKALAGSVRLAPTGTTALLQALDMYLDVKEAKPKKEAPRKEGATQSNRWVVVTAVAPGPDRDGKQVVRVTVAIDKDCYLYANPVGLEDLEAGRLTVSLTAGSKPHPATVAYPPAKAVVDKDIGTYRIYEGNVTINVRLDRPVPAGMPLEVQLRCQGFNHRGF